TDSLKSGRSASLLAWNKLGRAGREFISSGPTREDISTFTGRAALKPLRVYVGLRSADTPEARAKPALEELKRVGGFKRPVLIVVTPTGTGWVDLASIDSVEYLHDGCSRERRVAVFLSRQLGVSACGPRLWRRCRTSPELRWYPVVTLLQLTLDMLRATDATIGFGHVYALAHPVVAMKSAGRIA